MSVGMSVEVDITDDWARLQRELRTVDRKWFHIFRRRVRKQCVRVATMAAYMVPVRPLSGLPAANPKGWAKIAEPGPAGRPKTLVKIGVSGLGWTQAADLVHKPGVFKTNIDAKYGAAGTSRWVLPELDRATGGLLASIRDAIQRSWDELGALF